MSRGVGLGRAGTCMLPRFGHGTEREFDNRPRSGRAGELGLARLDHLLWTVDSIFTSRDGLAHRRFRTGRDRRDDLRLIDLAVQAGESAPAVPDFPASER